MRKFENILEDKLPSSLNDYEDGLIIEVDVSRSQCDV
jgi:hypothetical protein